MLVVVVVVAAAVMAPAWACKLATVTWPGQGAGEMMGDGLLVAVVGTQ